MDASEFVAQARQQGLATKLVEMVAYRPRPGRANEDTNEAYRRRVCLRFAQDFGPDDRDWLCCLLMEETALHEQLHQIRENLYLCAWMVAALRHADDALLLWKAKQANYSASLGVPDASLVAGGEAPVRRALRQRHGPDAEAFLDWLQEGPAVAEAEVKEALDMLKCEGF